MDILPSGNIFNELERICTTGYFSSQPSTYTLIHVHIKKETRTDIESEITMQFNCIYL